ncbi:hypothetical protein [Paraflavitalea pollutisoli]|uniref:hypothetical protein n=1 Tax=Paraflavitalea pollutisoli TaxID=3034143 RepID=UPI0023EC1BD8|nr:hypothetical protein [Paraflavitalea sp. H1-2-19X]
MSNQLVFYVRSSAFDRARALTFEDDMIRFDDKDRIGQTEPSIAWKDFDGVRMGVKWVKGYVFVIGRIYCIDIRSSKGEKIKIRLKSIYGINKDRIDGKFKDIVNALYDRILDEVITHQVQLVEKDGCAEIAGVQVTSKGVRWNKGMVVSWNDLEIKAFTNYFAIFQKSIPGNYKALEYVDEWNCHVLYSVITLLLQHKAC